MERLWDRRRAEARSGRLNGVVARQGTSVYKQKQEFDDRITMFRLEKIYILKDNCRMFTKTVIQKNETCICERKDSRVIGNYAGK